MTTLTTDTTAFDPKPGMRARIARAFRQAIERHGRKASRRDAIEALQRKSDAELARMGLRRENIAHHVFRDLYYI